MIQFILADRCNGCGDCAKACPTDVFDLTPAGVTIARQADCQTCFLCELYCPMDALYVGPGYHPEPACDEAEIRAAGLVGRYRRDSGWGEWEGDPSHTDEHWRMGRIFERAREAAAALNLRKS